MHPCTSRFSSKNYGCSSNTADTEVMAGCLAHAGFQLAENEAQADLLIYNTCAVKGPTENRVLNDVKTSPTGKKVIVAGCLPKISYERLCREAHFDGVVGPAWGKRHRCCRDTSFAGEKVIALDSPKEMPALSLPRQTSNPAVKRCTHKLRVFRQLRLLLCGFRTWKIKKLQNQRNHERIQADYEAGAREFWLTSQDTASYGRDLQRI